MAAEGAAQVDPRKRIVRVEHVAGSDLVQNPGNWRQHPDRQRAAMVDIMEKVGDVGVLLAYHSERAGGALTLIDGHMRASLAPEHQYYVAVTDLTDEEADLVLATHDPVGQMARANSVALDTLMKSIGEANRSVLDRMRKAAEGNRASYEFLRTAAVREDRPTEDAAIPSGAAPEPRPHQTPAAQSRFPLAIVLSTSEKQAWDAIKQRIGKRDDKAALMALVEASNA